MQNVTLSCNATFVANVPYFAEDIIVPNTVTITVLLANSHDIWALRTYTVRNVAEWERIAKEQKYNVASCVQDIGMDDADDASYALYKQLERMYS